MIDFQNSPESSSRSETVRVGAVTYLNSRPLIDGLNQLEPNVQLILDYPSRLADALAKKELDVALIPSVESFGDSNYQVVSNACISTHSDVFSVKLYCRVPPGAVRTLALDEGSRTSAALTRIMLNERFGVTPEIQSLPIGQWIDDSESDAILLIGDRAMKTPAEEFDTVWDLGKEWVDWTGLPFVFAMWIARKDASSSGIAQVLSDARDRGVANLDAIAAKGASELGLPLEMVQKYFTRNLHFHMGAAERAGLRLFKELAVEHGFAPSHHLEFQDESIQENSRIDFSSFHQKS